MQLLKPLLKRYPVGRQDTVPGGSRSALWSGPLTQLLNVQAMKSFLQKFHRLVSSRACTHCSVGPRPCSSRYGSSARRPDCELPAALSFTDRKPSKVQIELQGLSLGIPQRKKPKAQPTCLGHWAFPALRYHENLFNPQRRLRNVTQSRCETHECMKCHKANQDKIQGVS